MTANDLPAENTAGAAYTRAAAVLAYYAKGTGRSGRGADYEEMIADIIADLAIHCEEEAGVAAAEARAEGELTNGGSTVESICEQGAELARSLLNADYEASREDC